MTATFNIRDTKCSSTNVDVQLSVTNSVLDITVLNGSFKIANIDYTLLTDYTYTATNRTTDTFVFGYLVDDAGTIKLLVDEIINDGTDFPYKWAGGEQMLYCLFMFTVPANSTNLDAVTIDVIHTTLDTSLDAYAL